MTMLKKYGFRGMIKKFMDLSGTIPLAQRLAFGLSEFTGYLRGFIKHIYKWGYLGKFVFIGKNVYLEFKFNKYIGDNAYLRDYSRIEGRGELRIGNNSGIWNYGIIRATQSISIGDNVIIGPRVFMIDADHGFEKREKPIYLQDIIRKPITIGDDVYIGANVIILKGVSIGKGAVIGAGSIVTRDIPENSIAIGNPARVIGIRGKK